jgi:hypothetical protein
MYFDLNAFVRQKLYALTHGATDGPWLLTACQLLLYPAVHAAFALDEILHPEIATTPVQSPVFIVSSPRSGSTFLFELLAADPGTAWHTTHELICPSPTLRALWPPRIVAAANGLFCRRFAALQSIHPLRFDQPEEDELLFLLLGNSGIASYLFPYGPELDGLATDRFWEWPPAKRARFGRFYRRCIQRLLWSRRCGRYLAKSPHFLGKIHDLRAWYPDARFIYLLRSPMEWVPSALSMLAAFWRLSTARPPAMPAVERAYGALRDLALHGDAALAAMPENAVHSIRYTDLVADPEAVVRRVYAWLGWPLSAAFAERLARGAAWHRAWSSGHRYTLEQFDLSPRQIAADFHPLYEKYVFSTGDEGAQRRWAV